MKKLFTYLLLLLASSLLGCTQPYDDTEVRKDIENLKDRVTALEKLCKEMNANIDAMAAIIEALETHDYITGVTPITKDGETVGYTITFAKGEPITIYNGEDGKDGVNGANGANGADGADGKDGYTPIIGVAQDSDGIYYWTLDGEWLLDEAGNKIKAVGIDGEDGADGKDGADGEDGKDGQNGADGADGTDGKDGVDGENGADGKDGVDGITPQLKIENDYWYISYDNGSTWIQLGKATGEDGADGKDGDSFFQSVTQDEQYVYFTLADGTQITLPKGAVLSISFDANDLVVMVPNSTCEISYSVQSVTESVTVEVTSSSDLRAKVVPASADGKSGNIVVTSSGVVDEYSKVIVFVSNGEKVIMKSISFEQAGITISNGAEQTIGAEGGSVNLNFASNIDWKVAIPAEAQSWVQLAPQRSAMTEYSVALSVAPNTNLGTRSATVQVMTKDGSLAVDYTITQSAFEYVRADAPENWQLKDELSVFMGNDINQRFRYIDDIEDSKTLFRSVGYVNYPTSMSANYAVYPYKSSYLLSQKGELTIPLASVQSYVVDGYNQEYNIMVAKSSDNKDTYFEMQPICAYVCVKLWGSEQTIKSVTLASKGGEALAGNASVTPKFGAAPECVFTTNTSSTISMSCTELTIGSAEASATEFWFVVPPVALASGYSVKVAGFYGGEQTIDFPATTFASGTTYNVGAEVTVSTNGPGMGIGGWGDGENVEGEI